MLHELRCIDKLRNFDNDPAVSKNDAQYKSGQND